MGQGKPAGGQRAAEEGAQLTGNYVARPTTRPAKPAAAGLRPPRQVRRCRRHPAPGISCWPAGSSAGGCTGCRADHRFDGVKQDLGKGRWRGRAVCKGHWGSPCPEQRTGVTRSRRQVSLSALPRRRVCYSPRARTGVRALCAPGRQLRGRGGMVDAGFRYQYRKMWGAVLRRTVHDLTGMQPDREPAMAEVQRYEFWRISQREDRRNAERRPEARISRHHHRQDTTRVDDG